MKKLVILSTLTLAFANLANAYDISAMTDVQPTKSCKTFNIPGRGLTTVCEGNPLYDYFMSQPKNKTITEEQQFELQGFGDLDSSLGG